MTEEFEPWGQEKKKTSNYFVNFNLMTKSESVQSKSEEVGNCNAPLKKIEQLNAGWMFKIA